MVCARPGTRTPGGQGRASRKMARGKARRWRHGLSNSIAQDLIRENPPSVQPSRLILRPYQHEAFAFVMGRGWLVHAIHVALIGEGLRDA
jgi:hypothetical protein